MPATPYDVTIVGSGPAGLYLAESLGKSGFRVLVVEQGALDEPLSQGEGFYEIDATGLSYLPLGERLAAFGGTSGHWGGQSRPLSPSIFKPRPHLRSPGWPITFEAFQRHLPAANRWLRHPSEVTYFEPPAEGFPLAPAAGLATHPFVAATPQRRLGSELRDWIATSRSVNLLPAHRVINMTLDEAGAALASLQVISMRDSRRKTFPVRQVVLATGGIENARLMLAAGRWLPEGNPFTGRHRRTGATFMEHPKPQPLEVYFDRSFPPKEARWHGVPGSAINIHAYSIDDLLLKKLELPQFAVFFWSRVNERAEVDDRVRQLDRALYGREISYRMTLPEFAFEQLPRDDSFVALSAEVDMHGEPRARLHWAIGDDEMRNYWRAAKVFARLISQNGSMRARLAYPTFEDFAAAPMVTQHHHMGTTAMSADSRTGVVDANCRVHDVANLYVAGSSVFTTSDYVNPTMNIVALADRLAQHLINLAA